MTTLVHAYHNVIEHETKRKMATHEVKASAFKALKDLLRRTMIRHTKSQRIQGAVALALPDEVCSTIFLDMTAAERRQYVDALNRPMKPATTRRLAEGGKTFARKQRLAQLFIEVWAVASCFFPYSLGAHNLHFGHQRYALM